MSDIAIKVQGLGKEYRVGKRERYKTVRETLMSFVTAPFRRDHKVEGEEGSERFWALRDVEFEVNRGEVIGVIGSNGAGKSTLLKILSRITDPTKGRVEIEGRVGSLLEVGTGFHPELTGRENVYLNGAILGMRRSEIQRKFDEIVAFSEIERFLDTPVKHYSSGMYMRLAFAVAAHLDPEILIVDEVLAVGDVAFQKKCLGKMKEVSDQGGRTVIFVSHHMAAIAKLCTSGIVLSKGTLAFHGPVDQAVDRYLQSAAATLQQRRSMGSQGSAVSQPVFISDAWMEVSGHRSERFDFRETAASVVVSLVAHQRVTFGLELVLRDAVGNAVAFGPSGLAANMDFTCDPGNHTFRCELPSLELAEGAYSIDILLAESGVRLIDSIESALRFSIERTLIGSKNWNFNQSTGRGCVLWNVAFSKS